MNTDLIGSIGLTASAAILIAALSIGFGSNAKTRLCAAVGFSLWFVLVAVLAATHALYYEHGLGAPGLGIAVTLPIAVLCFVVARTQSLREAFRRVPLWLLIGVHTVRLLGISFIILYADHRLPAPFAPVAGWGDIFVGATALPVAWLAYRRPANARPIIWIWNLVGLVDLMAAVGLGVISSPGPQRLIFAEPGSAIMTTLPWLLIPGFLVPLLFTVHIGIFIRLAQRQPISDF
ncbi:MAG TPA: hypothetical protein VGQ70_04890 [Candidatus Udaeobacter sp.]|nr:hypothetical protein [Candidatus Udaeobacter sp.]